MAGAVVSIAQQKGGSGKTTLAVQLATTLKHMGQRVALVDLDPQASLTSWYDERLRWRGLATSDVVVESVRSDMASTLETLRDRFDVVLLDSPSRADSETRIAVRLADLVLIPCQPQALDLWATTWILKLAQAARRPALIIFNRVPPRSRVADRIRAVIASYRWPVARHWLGNRQAFAASVEVGHGVIEVESGCRASREMIELAQEIIGYVSGLKAS